MNHYTRQILALLIYIYLIFSILGCSTLKGESWDIHNGQLTLNDGENDVTAKAYWAQTLKVIPNELLIKYIASFKLFTDGIDEDLGGVSPLNKWNTKWELDIDTIDFDLQAKDSAQIINYTHTLIHEFGHLLTLNPEQITFTRDKRQKDEIGYLTAEGYAKPSSYLGQFIQQFWKKPLLTEWDNIQGVILKSKRWQLLDKFYLAHKEQFLTDYAAESPEEDIAESWTFFVLADKPEASSVKEQKILFFYGFPELLAYRKEIWRQLQIISPKYDSLKIVCAR